MKKQLKKLKLNKQTVQVLNKDEQNKVVGGRTHCCTGTVPTVPPTQPAPETWFDYPCTCHPNCY